MSHARARVLAGMLCVLVVLPGLAAREAGAAPKYRSQLVELLVDVTAIEVSDWAYATSGYGDDDAPWTAGIGQQRIAYSTPRPARFHALTTNGAYGTPKLSIGGALRPARVRASVTREAKVTDHDPPPACEGCGTQASRTWNPPQQCGRRALRGDQPRLRYEPRSGLLEVEIPADVRGRYDECAPTSSQMDYDINNPTFRLTVPRAERIRTLRRGGRVVLRGRETWAPGCTKPSPRRDILAFQLCKTRHVTVEVTRVR